MRIIIALAPLLLAGDPTPTAALKKLAEKKTFSFTIETKTEGDALGNAARGMETPISGAFEKADTYVVKLGRAGAEANHKGGKTAITLDGKDWQTPDEALKAAQGEDRPNPTLDRLLSIEAPQAEWLWALGKVAGLAKQKELEEGSVAFLGAFTKDAAKELAEELTEGPAQREGQGNRGRAPNTNRFGRPGNYARGGGNNGAVSVKESAGTVKFLVGKEDELPHGMVYTLKVKLVQQRDGKPQESEVTVTRTWKFADFDTAKVELTDGAKAKLGVK